MKGVISMTVIVEVYEFNFSCRGVAFDVSKTR